MKIRDAVDGDVPELLALYRYLTPEDPPCDARHAQEVLKRIAAFPGSAVLVAETEDGAAPALVGSVTMIVIPNLSRGGAPYALIENVVTHGDRRGQGIGKAMLADAAERAWAAGCYKVMLMTGSRRASTLGFYRAAGFEQSKTGFQMRRRPARAEA